MANEVLTAGGDAWLVLRNREGEIVGVSIIDAADAPKVVDRPWHLTSHGYVCCRTKGESVYLHRLIAGGGEHVDHKDGDKLNNRRANLRPCSVSQNLANSSARKTSKTGVKGVYPYRRDPSKFYAQITHQRKVYHLGVFGSLEEAVTVRNAKALELFGDFHQQ